MLNFTNNVINQAYENFMKQIPGFHREPAEAKVIQKDIEQQKTGTATLVDTGDVHAMMIGAAGVGKTAHWLYPCIEYALPLECHLSRRTQIIIFFMTIQILQRTAMVTKFQS